MLHAPGRQSLLLTMSFMAAFGPLGEIFVGSFYQLVFEQPLWQYQIFPVHHGYTSLIAPFIWAIAGAEFHTLYPVLKKRVRQPLVMYALIACEILIVELLLNVSAHIFLGTQLFYYIPGDLGHYSSLQTLPFYFLAGLVMVRATRYMKPHPNFFAASCVGMAFVVVYLAN